MNNSIEFLSSEFQQKNLLLPAGSGDIILFIAKSLSKLFSISQITYKNLEQNLIKSCKILTNASWVEVLIKDQNKLRVLGDKQQKEFFEINSNSLPGFVAENKLFQIINNPQSSPFYSSFGDKLLPFSREHECFTEPSSVCAIPVFSGSEELMGVVILYNKLNHKMEKAQFVHNDVLIVQASALLLFELFNYSKFFNKLQQSNTQLLSNEEENMQISQLSSQLTRRKNLLARAKELIKTENVITDEMIKLLSDCMKAQATVLYLNVSQELEPVFVYGTNNEQEQVSIIKSQTSKFAGFTEKKVLNIPDLSADPLWGDRPLLFHSLLSCPILDINKQTMGVIEFFRNTPFTELEEKYGESLMRTLRKIPHSKWNLMSTLNEWSSNSYKDINIKVKSLYCFSLDPEHLYDYSHLFDQIRKSFRKLISYDSCTIYIADQKKMILWTKKFGSPETVVAPIIIDSLIGHTYFSKRAIVLPTEEPLAISDMQVYKQKSVLCFPMQSSLVDYPVIGLLLFIRSNQSFQQSDIETVNHFSIRLAKTFENIYVNSFHIDSMKPLDQDEKFQIIEQSSSANSETKRINILSSGHRSGNEDRDITTIWKSSVAIDFLLQVDLIPKQKLDRLAKFRALIEQSGNPIAAFAKNLGTVIPCQQSAFFLKETTDDQLFNITNESLYKSAGFINICISNNQTIVHREGAYKHPHFDSHIDSLGAIDSIESIMSIPISNFYGGVDGVISFVNSPDRFPVEDMFLAQYISLIPREILQAKDGCIANWQQILKEGRRHKMLQQWYKQVFTVANAAQYKQVLAKDILQRIAGENTLDMLVKSSLQIMCALTNSEYSRIIVKDGWEYSQYTTEGRTCLLIDEHQESIFQRILETQSPMSLGRSDSRENSMFVPHSTDGKTIIIELWNKKDESLSLPCNYSREDEIIVGTLGKVVANALYSSSTNSSETLSNLRQALRSYTFNMNTQPFISTIRNAAQRLLGCDRGTVFIREGKSLIVKAQGIEQEIPVGFSCPIGKGIVGYVAQTGVTENIKDVYQDQRFNKEVDMITGYKTSNMLCMPVLDSQGEVIAALQMINKKQGHFDKSDEETLEIFSEMVSTVMQNWNLFQKTIEERTRLMNILNSIGNYILVLNSDGKLDYANKSFEGIFGVTEKLAKSTYYASWLKYNRQLVIDVTNIYQFPSKRIHRNSQRILAMPMHKSTSIPNFKTYNFAVESKYQIFNYTLAALQDFSTLEAAGVIIILEDATAIEELNSKFKAMQSQLMALTNPVQTETSLQRCINKLSLISGELEQSSELSSQLQEIISTLKRGNLNRAEVKLPLELKSLESELKGRLKEYAEFSQPNSIREPYKLRKSISDENSGMLGVPLESLRSWTLNSFEVEDHFKYIKAMLIDFDLMKQFQIKGNRLKSFYNRVKENYPSNPFHNFFHAFSVMHSCYLVLRNTKAEETFNNSEILAMLISSVCHDVGHTGHNNAFEVNSNSEYAISYNDKSVLENFHSASTFRILRDHSCNIFENLPHDLCRSVRKLMIECILGTDMIRHFTMISNMTARFKDLEDHPLGTLEDDIEKLAAFIVHTADLAHPSKDFTQYSRFSRLVCEEFTHQYNEEVQNGLPTHEFMKGLDEPKAYFKNELGFLTVIVKPLWECLGLWLSPGIDQCLINLNENIRKYQQKSQELLG